MLVQSFSVAGLIGSSEDYMILGSGVSLPR
jgi:hypothetical protein